MTPTKHSCVQFGIYEVDLDAGELRKAGLRTKVQQQPFKVLQALLERPGDIVTREELHDRIWPSTGFGDFDQAVNVAVAKLRTALGDSADNPRFIETLPRRGYRFIAPIYKEAVPVAEFSPPATVAPGQLRSSVLSPESSRHSLVKRAATILLGAIGVVAICATLILNLRPRQSDLNFHRISYGKGAIRSARFGPDGHSILYGAAWNGKAMQLFWAQAQSPESRPYQLPDADILAVSPEGELAVLINRRAGLGWISRGTLALMPIAGAVPREVLENVQDADWDREGKNLAIVHWVGKQCKLEFPIGTVIYEVTGGHWLSDVRISPRGDSLAFLEHPLEGDDAGYVALVDLKGHKKVVTPFWLSVRGLAWDPSSDALWFSAGDLRGERERPRAIYSLTLPAKLQRVAGESSNLTLHDLSPQRELLLSRDAERYEILANASGQARDLSWLDFSRADDLSADGKNVLLTVEGEAAGKDYEVYLRKTDGSPPVKLGEGYGSAISPDGQWVLAVAPFGSGLDAVPQFTLLPIGKGTPKALTHDAIAHYAGSWFPDGSRIVFLGSKPGEGVRVWTQDLQGAAPQAITPEGVVGTRISPDGKYLCTVDAEGAIMLYPVGQNKPVRPIGIEKGESPLGWSSSGRELFVARSDYLPVKVYKIDWASGKRELVRELAPADPAGVLPDVSSVFATPDGTVFVYSYFRLQSDLYVATLR
jgi:DNA-binding winged helix-turn-helix (wHTH) protein/WD40 repeat protein